MFVRYVRNDPNLIKKIWFYGNSNIFWSLNGNLHREDGPAIEMKTGYKEWYLEGKKYYTEQEYWKALGNLKLRKTIHEGPYKF